MITKTVNPIMGEELGIGYFGVLGTTAEYRIWGILIYKKTIYTPAKYGAKDWEYFPVEF